MLRLLIRNAILLFEYKTQQGAGQTGKGQFERGLVKHLANKDLKLLIASVVQDRFDILERRLGKRLEDKLSLAKFGAGRREYYSERAVPSVSPQPQVCFLN